MSKAVVKDLRLAMRTDWPVRIVRKRLKKDDDIDGYVLQVGPDWVLLAALSQTVYLDGWEVVRISDINEVEFRSEESRRYIDRAVGELAADGRAPGELSVTSLGRSRATLRSMVKAAPLLTFHCEARYPGEMYVGSVLSTGKKKLRVQFIDPSGEWDDYVRGFRLADVTRVSVGGRYNDALARFGDRRPELRAG
jgi:hypothetical protein